MKAGCWQQRSAELFFTHVFCALFVSWASSLATRDPHINLFVYAISVSTIMNLLKLSTTDLLVLASMKNAAKCDT
jgi:uncharacterized membrane protein (DUF106 family)